MGAMANKRKAVGATALHASLKMKGGSAHIVGIGDLRVILSKEDGSWFAQALEIDYFAEGVSLEDVKKRFEDGLVLTIDENLPGLAAVSRPCSFRPQGECLRSWSAVSQFAIPGCLGMCSWMNNRICYHPVLPIPGNSVLRTAAPNSGCRLEKHKKGGGAEVADDGKVSRVDVIRVLRSKDRLFVAAEGDGPWL